MQVMIDWNRVIVEVDNGTKGITLQLKGDYDGGLGELRKSREMWLQLGDQGQVDSMDEAISTLRETQELHARIKQLCESALAAKNAGDAEKEFRAWIDLYFAFKCVLGLDCSGPFRNAPLLRKTLLF